MRLLKIGADGALVFTQDLVENIPSYAILSHTWGSDEEEVTFHDLRTGSGKTKTGYRKLEFCRNQARKDGLQYFWVDTCCIDKANHSELSEAIVSMYQWYHKSAKCYVFLADVSARQRNVNGELDWESAFRNSRWFTRGWTLQELLAPGKVDFYSREGCHLGDKLSLEQMIHRKTRIPVEALRGAPLPQFSATERLRWSDGRDTRRIEDRAYCLFGLFDVYIPVVYGEGNRAFDRLKDEIGRLYRKDLEGVAPAKSAPSPPDLCTDDAGLLERRRELLRSLAFDQMDSRRLTIGKAESTTCQWLLEHPSYQSWLTPEQIQEHGGFLWIKGHPGTGKSTLVKFAHAHAYASTKSLKDNIVINFFFNARGDELEKSTAGMYRALLFQLLKGSPELQSILDEVPRDPVWTVELLCDRLSAIVSNLEGQRIWCFVDALDECDEQQVRDMVFFLEDLGQQAFQRHSHIYTCFASRHYPTIRLDKSLQLILEQEPGHRDDIAKYVQNHLRAGTSKYVEEIKMEVMEKANGIFLWVVLVIAMLNKEFLTGRIYAVRKRLEEVPVGLSNLFRDIVTRDGTNLGQFLLCLRWILFARRPLSPSEFYFAMAAGLDPDFDQSAEWDHKHVTSDDMARYVYSSSKGLAELSATAIRAKSNEFSAYDEIQNSEPYINSYRVQLIHESVRDFLVRDGGLSELFPELDGGISASSHEQLKHCCQIYLEATQSSYARSTQPALREREFRLLLACRFPFLGYATEFVFHHSNEAAAQMSQDQFLIKVQHTAWLEMIFKFEYFWTAAECDLLIWTLYHGYAIIAQRLIALTGVNWRVKTYRGHNALLLATAEGYEAIIRAFLTLENVPVNTCDRQHRTPLMYAAHQGNETITTALISHGADIHIRDKRGRTALSWVAETPHSAVLRLLLSQGSRVNTQDKFGHTPLIYAAEHKQKLNIQILLEYEANVNMIDDRCRFPLWFAVMPRHEPGFAYHINGKFSTETMNSAIRHFDNYGRVGSLAWQQYIKQVRSAKNLTEDREGRLVHPDEDVAEIVDIVQLLLTYGADPNLRDYIGKTPLMLASQIGWDPVVKLLLDSDAEVDVKDKDGKTALLCAAEGRSGTIVQALLVRGADCTHRDLSGRSALDLAILQPPEIAGILRAWGSVSGPRA